MLVERKFKRIVSSRLSDASWIDFKIVVLSVWHEGYIPQISELSHSERVRAAYLIDRLRRYNVVPDKDKARLKRTLDNLNRKIIYTNARKESLLVKDDLASHYGLCNESLKIYFKECLKYQTRHYKHKELIVE